MKPLVSVIMVSYNTKVLTLEAIQSLIGESSGMSMEILVVDNCSSDGSADAIEQNFPSIRMIRSPVNLGFAKANNIAAAEATGEYLMLLNPDTLVLDRAIEILVRFAVANPAAGIWGGRTVFGDRRLNPASCWGRQTLWSVMCVASGASSLFRNSRIFNPEALGGWPRDVVREVDIVSGCFFMIRRELWHQLGGFDPAFFMYGEEADLCLRARRLGARPKVTPEATIVHYGGASERVRADKMVRLLKAKSLLIRRHWPRATSSLGVWLLTMWPLTRAVAWTLLRWTRRDGGSVAARAWWEIWHRRAEWLHQEHTGNPTPAVGSGGGASA